MDKLTWWLGSNGNLFADAAEFRYSIGQEPRGTYWVARNGEQIDSGLLSTFDAKLVAQQDAEQQGH